MNICLSIIVLIQRFCCLHKAGNSINPRGSSNIGSKHTYPSALHSMPPLEIH